MNWNASQTREPVRTCPECNKRFKQDEPGCCSAKCYETWRSWQRDATDAEEVLS